MSSATSAPERRLLKKEEAAQILAISVRKLEQLLATGEMRAKRIGRSVRLETAEVERFITSLAGTK